MKIDESTEKGYVSFNGNGLESEWIANDCILMCSFFFFPYGSQVEQGSKTELPFWLAHELHLRQAVSMSVPACFNQK